MSKFAVIRFIVTVVVLLAVGRGASAQTPLAVYFDDAFTPDFLKTDLPTFRRVLALDEQQTTIVESLLHDYGERFEGALRMVREELRAAQQAMGVEDPRVDEEREQIRAEIATLFEEMQSELQNLQPGSDAGEVQMKYEHHMKLLQERLQALSARRINPEELSKLFNEAAARLTRWRQERAAIRQQFVEDLLTVISTDQQALWPTLERQLLRERTLSRSLLQGEGVDLFLVVRDLQLIPDEQAAIAPRLGEYELALDAALRARNERIESSTQEIFQAMLAGNRPALINVIDRITSTRVALRNINDETAAILASELGEKGPRLVASYRQRAYPLLFRDTQTMRLIKAALEIPELTFDQRQSLEAVRDAYAAELAAIEEQTLADVRQHEPTQITRREALSLMPPIDVEEVDERDQQPDGVQRAFDRRNEIGNRYDAQIRTLLTDEQYERLPRNSRLIREPIDADDQ